MDMTKKKDIYISNTYTYTAANAPPLLSCRATTDASKSHVCGDRIEFGATQRM
jgi:hypothetical protein